MACGHTIHYRRLQELGFLPDADGFAHYAETRFGTLCRHYAGGLCALYAGLCRKFLNATRSAS
eukprot:COSAG02_NODE_22900_length_736_cov_1.265306_1_plen_63_part_00